MHILHVISILSSDGEGVVSCEPQGKPWLAEFQKGLHIRDPLFGT